LSYRRSRPTGALAVTGGRSAQGASSFAGQGQASMDARSASFNRQSSAQNPNTAAK